MSAVTAEIGACSVAKVAGVEGQQGSRAGKGRAEVRERGVGEKRRGERAAAVRLPVGTRSSKGAWGTRQSSGAGVEVCDIGRGVAAFPKLSGTRTGSLWVRMARNVTTWVGQGSVVSWVSKGAGIGEVGGVADASADADGAQYAW